MSFLKSPHQTLSDGFLGFLYTSPISLREMSSNTLIPVLRCVPIKLALYAGAKTTKYRWWALCYIFGMFFIVPALAFFISVLSTIALTVIIGVIGVFIIFILSVNALRERKPEILPKRLKSWKWLPTWMRSLEPIDRVICSKVKWCHSEKRMRSISEISQHSAVASSERNTNSASSATTNLAFVEEKLEKIDEIH